MFTNHNDVNSISELNGYHYDDQLTPNNVWFHSIEKLNNLSDEFINLLRTSISACVQVKTLFSIFVLFPLLYPEYAF